MSSWTEGYVAEIPYTPGYYRELSPALLALNLAIRNVRAPDLTGALNYCELGFGMGLSLLTHAAAFPNIHFYGTDFNPAHAAHAQELATTGGLTNVSVFDDSFEQLLARDLPAMDFIVLHGIYSWVSPANRKIIVDFIDRRLKPGGVVYVSYNALPGWSAGAPLRALMRLHSQRQSAPGTPMLDKVAQAIGFLGEMNGKGMRYFKSVPGMDGRIERLGAANTSYVAHEYLNQEWHPQYFHEVVAEMSAARLEYVCAGQLSDNIDAAILPSDALKHLNSVHDQVMRETLRDYYLNTQFRRDLYTRGATRLSGEAQTEILMTQRWLLITAVAGIQYKVATSGGDVTLEESAHRPIIEALAQGPATTQELLGRPELQALGKNRLLQGLILFASVGYVHPMLPNSVATSAMGGAQRYNAAIAARGDAGVNYVACPLSGQAVARTQLSLAQSDLYRRGLREPAAMAEALGQIMTRRGQQLVKDGKPLEDGAAAETHLLEMVNLFLDQELPQLQRLGLVA